MNEDFMTKEELHKMIESQQSNICQIEAFSHQPNRLSYNDDL